LSPMGLLSHYQTFRLSGNPLAMAGNVPNDSLVVSVDLLHLPGSVAKPRTEEIPGAESLQVVKFEGMDWNASSTFHFREFDIAGADYPKTLPEDGDLWTVLYSLGNLRKRAGGE